MNWTPAEAIARAVLYEGVLLYPYRSSALKNQKRWTFGAAHPGASFAPGTECLLEGTRETRLSVKLRFLQETSSGVEEREVSVEELSLERILEAPEYRQFSFPPLEGVLECRADPLTDPLFKITLQVANRGLEGSPEASLLSCHALLAVRGGAFLSMIDPPEPATSAALQCARRGLWPVLVGAPPDRSLVLAAPIILSDYPAVAPESPQDFCDGTEIDEMLSLRILTLSDKEKEEIRRGDPRGRRILERTESLSNEELLSLHGRMTPGPSAFVAGDRVRLWPRGRADIMDLALEGKTATVVAVDEDLEGRRYLSVTVSDDPGRDLGEGGWPGHRFFFRPDEVERL